MSQRFQSALDVLDEHILEGLLVKAFQSHLTVFYKYKFFHIYLL